MFLRSTTFALALFCIAPLGRAQESVPSAVGRALTASKVLTAADGAEALQAINGGCVIIGADGLIEAVGRAGEVEIPEGYEEIDLGDLWLAPGMVDLHSHIAGTFDINDTVYQVNPGLRVAPSVVPGNGALRRGLAAGVTTILFIPGSGSNIGGQGVLLKTGLPTFEEMRLRDPGSLKVAQGDNPTRWGYGMRRGMMNFNIRTTFRRGLSYAKAWERFESGETKDEPERNIGLDIFRELRSGEAQISTHTQYYQLVMMSILLLKGEFGFPTYVDHGSFDSYLTGPLALEHDVPAILGPRAIMWPRPPRFDTDGQAQGPAWGYQQAGVKDIGFNTDAPVLPQEELPLQAAMGVRYGMDDSEMESIRGLTIVPARVAGIDDRVGSIEVGKHADLIATTGDPADPRSAVHRVWIEGRPAYDSEAEEVRTW